MLFDVANFLHLVILIIAIMPGINHMITQHTQTQFSASHNKSKVHEKVLAMSPNILLASAINLMRYSASQLTTKLLIFHVGTFSYGSSFDFHWVNFLLFCRKNVRFNYHVQMFQKTQASHDTLNTLSQI